LSGDKVSRLCTGSVRWILGALPLLLLTELLSDQIHERKASLPKLALDPKPPLVHPHLGPAADSPDEGTPLLSTSLIPTNKPRSVLDLRPNTGSHLKLQHMTQNLATILQLANSRPNLLKRITIQDRPRDPKRSAHHAIPDSETSTSECAPLLHRLIRSYGVAFRVKERLTSSSLTSLRRNPDVQPAQETFFPPI
jgi:hypothetical protein